MRVVFANGSPAQQAIVKTSIPDWLAQSFPLMVTVSFVEDPGGSADFFAYTTVAGGAATVQFDHLFPNFEAPFDGEAFARETVAHEFSHIAQAWLSEAGKGAISGLFTPAGGPWESGAWEDHVAEGDAEQLKDVLTALMPPGSRKFTNRSSYRLAAGADFEAWVGVHNDSIGVITGEFGSYTYDESRLVQVSLGGAITYLGEHSHIILVGEGGGPSTEEVYRSWEWTGTFDSWWGAASVYSGSLRLRWKWAEPLPEVPGFPGSGIYESHPIYVRITRQIGSNPPEVGPFLEVDEGMQPYQDAHDWRNATFGAAVPDENVWNSTSEGYLALFDDPALFAELPWITKIEFVYSNIGNEGEVPPLPELQIEMMSAPMFYVPAPLVVFPVSPDNPGPPPPPPARLSKVRIGIPLSHGRRRSSHRIVSTRGSIMIDDLNDEPVVEDEIIE